MAAFLGDIAFLFGIAVAVGGLFTLHRAGTDPRPTLLKVAGVVLLLAGLGTAACTTYYYYKYHKAGDLDHPFPVSAGAMAMMMGKGGGMGMGAMMGGDTNPGGPHAQSGDGAAGPAAPDVSEEEHQAHHPESAGDTAE